MDRLVTLWLLLGIAAYNLLLNVFASIVFAYMQIGPKSLVYPGVEVVRAHAHPVLAGLAVWSCLTVYALYRKWRKGEEKETQHDDPPRDENSTFDQRGQHVQTQYNAGRDQTFYQDRHLEDIKQAARDLDLGTISRFGKMEGAIVNSIQDTAAISFDSDGDITAVMPASRVGIPTFSVRDPEKIVQGGDIVGALRNKDTLTIPRSELTYLHIPVDGKDISGTLPHFDILIIRPPTLGEVLTCFFIIEELGTRIDNVILETFALDDGRFQVTNKNQQGQPFEFTATMTIREMPEDRERLRLSGEMHAHFWFQPEKATYVRQILGYQDLMDALTQYQKIHIRRTADGELRYILSNTSMPATSDPLQARLIEGLRAAQCVAGYQDLRLPKEFDEGTWHTLEFIAEIVSKGKAELPLEHVQPPDGIGIPVLVAEEILAKGNRMIQFPVTLASNADHVEVLGADLDLGPLYILLPPVRVLITLDELRARIAATTQGGKVPIPCEVLPIGPKRAIVYYPRFLPDAWEEEADAELAAREVSRRMRHLGTRGAPFGRKVYATWSPSSQTYTRCGVPTLHGPDREVAAG